MILLDYIDILLFFGSAVLGTSLVHLSIFLIKKIFIKKIDPLKKLDINNLEMSLKEIYELYSNYDLTELIEIQKKIIIILNKTCLFNEKSTLILEKLLKDSKKDNKEPENE